jgi:hypothetical protein
LNTLAAITHEKNRFPILGNTRAGHDNASRALLTV